MQKRLLTNGNIFKRTDNRWGGVVWYMNEVGEKNERVSQEQPNLKSTKRLPNTFLNLIKKYQKTTRATKGSKTACIIILKYLSIRQ